MQSFRRAAFNRDQTIKNLRETAQRIGLGWSEEEVLAYAERRLQDEVLVNDQYRVIIREEGEWLVLSIMRLDGGPIAEHWRTLQAIKDAILGEECEAAELYPARSRRSGEGTYQYHLWASRDPQYRFPFGFLDDSESPELT